jgi:hypothetical protein
MKLVQLPILMLALLLCIGRSLAVAADNVAGNLIQFNSDGNWSWYMDERAIIDPTNNRLLVSSQASSNATGIAGGTVFTTSYDLSTGRRTPVVMRNSSAITVSNPNGGGQEDDHNAGGLLVLPSGKYLTMYSNHGNTAGLGDEFSWWRVSSNPHDPTSWANQKSFNWNDPAQNPGRDPTNGDANNVAYHNLFYLRGDVNNANDDRVYDISRATNQAPNILEYNPTADTMTWRGQLLTNSVGGYSTGYLKYASNNTDKVYFVSTETHPRNYNTSIYAGYLSLDGKSYKMDGTLVDANSFDNTRTGGTVPNVTSFTPVVLSQPEGVAGNRTHMWTTDLALDSNGYPVALETARGGVSSSFTGTPAGADYSDHRLWYSRYNGTSWVTHEVARLGQNLFTPEEDYTGLGAIRPDDPNVLYISTPINPATGAATAHREIYKGITSDTGATWNWTAITSNSSVDNLRPIIPKWDAQSTAVLWFRGTYTTAQNIDAAVVGIVDRSGEQSGLVHYVDATSANTTRSNDAAIGATGPSTAEGAADGNWHVRTGLGNGAGNDILASGATGAEDAPALATTLTGFADGTYDIFAYFWADQSNDWRIRVGLDPNSLMLVRDNGAQQATISEFDPASGPMTLSGAAGASLYRQYVGRVNVLGSSSISVYIDDQVLSSAAAGTTRAWYDGVGYALVPEPASIGATVLCGLALICNRRRRRHAPLAICEQGI